MTSDAATYNKFNVQHHRMARTHPAFWARDDAGLRSSDFLANPEHHHKIKCEFLLTFVNVESTVQSVARSADFVPLRVPRPSVISWNNAFDPRDIVAPPDAANFDVPPGQEVRKSEQPH
jgi:hypothetical protein